MRLSYPAIRVVALTCSRSEVLRTGQKWRGRLSLKPPVTPAASDDHAEPGSVVPAPENWTVCIAPYNPSRASSCWCVPCSTIFPLLRTMILFASRIVDSRWAMTMDVRPRMIFRSERWICSSVWESILAVASSRTSTRGSNATARANERSCCSPEKR